MIKFIFCTILYEALLSYVSKDKFSVGVWLAVICVAGEC